SRSCACSCGSRRRISMIGDDVVDLADPDADAGSMHPRFDRRVFHPHERALIARSAQPGHTRWLLWALKESAYKAARKDDPAAVFRPGRSVAALEDGPSAMVCVGARRFRAAVCAGEGYVPAVARRADDPPACTEAAVRRLASSEESPRTAVRRLVGERLA